MSARPATTHVVCFGNAWHGDDGFGLHVLRCLHERRTLPPGVQAFDAGTAGLNALPFFESCAKAVIVDAVRAGGPVGTVHRLTPAELAPARGDFSLHGLGVSSLVAALSASPDGPEIVLIGAEVGEIRTFTEGLGPLVRAAVPVAVECVLLECSGQSPRGGRRPAQGIALSS